MTVLQLPFRLPQSCVRIAGTRAFAHDALLDRDDVSAQATVTLDVIAERELSALRIAEGVLADTDVGFEWTDDGRLVTSSVELTGRAGAVAVGVVSAATSVAGVLLGAPALALARAAAPAAPAPRPAGAAAAGADRAADGVAAADGAATADGAAAAGGPAAADGAPAPDRDAQAVGAAYRAAHPDESEARETCASLIPELARGLADALRRVPGAADGKARAEALGAVRAVEGALAAARAQAGALDEHFRAWRATTVATRLEHYEFLLELDTIVAAQALPELVDGRLRGAGDGDAGSLAALAAVQAAFDALGVMVVVTDDPPAAPATPHADGAVRPDGATRPDGAARSDGAPAPDGARRPLVAENEIVVRLPRRVRLTVYELGAGDELVKRSSSAALVMDGRCPHATVELTKALFGKRAVKLGFSAGSALESLRVGAASGAAAAAEAAGALPNAVALGLERSRKIVTRAAALRFAALDQRLSVLTRELQLKRQEIAEAGLQATAGSYAELQALKRQVALLEQRKALAALEADLGITATADAATADAATADTAVAATLATSAAAAADLAAVGAADQPAVDTSA